MKNFKTSRSTSRSSRRLRLFGSVLGLASMLSLTACGDDEEDSTAGDGDGDVGDGDGDGDSVETASYRITLANLEPLAGGFEYEGWFISDDGPVSAGRFNLEEGETTATVSVPSDAADGASMYVLTIEPPADEDEPEPSSTHVLAGPWEDGGAELSVDAEAALGSDFSEATGQFFLETPTSAEPDDYSLGIWFITPGDAPSAGLDLPVLPDGWMYEGWVAGPDGPISTGRFVDPAGADDDAGGPAAGDEDAPPFPGQDFIDPELDLLGDDYVAVISVEPEPDDSEAPFAFKPLVGMITDEGSFGEQDLDNMADNAPSGSVETVE